MTADTSAEMPTADFGTRFSAFMIDGMLLFAAQWIIFIVLSRQLQAVGLTSTESCVPDSVAQCEGPSTLLWALLLLFLVGSTIGYHAVFEGRFGATPGKQWMGLQVVDAQGRSPIGLTAGFLRSLVRQAFWISLLFVVDASPLSLGLPSVLFVALPLLALGVFVWGAMSADGRAVHDLVAATYVVRSDQVLIRPTRSPGQTPDAPDVVADRPSNTKDSEDSA